MPRLKYVIVSFDHFLLGYDVRMIDRHRVDAYRRVGIEPEGSGRSIMAWLERHSYLMRYRTLILKKFLSAARRRLGWVKAHRLVGRRALYDKRMLDEQGNERARFHMTDAYDRANEDKSFHYLDEIFRLSAERNINIIMITPPVQDAYLGKLSDRFLARFHELRDAWIARQGRRAPTYFDLSNSKLFGEGDFSDVDHLNARGAAKLTAFVNNLIRKAVNDPETK